jgi:hypoxanthine phosphoribosyltransferase
MFLVPYRISGIVNSLFGLAGEVISEEYSLEYGTDIMEMHVGAVQAGERALVIDDLIATGGTLCAAIRLLGNVFKLKHQLNFTCKCI